MQGDFGREFRRLRTAAGLTLKEVADEFGVSVTYVSDIERGRRNPPAMDKIERFCQLCRQPDAFGRLAELAIAERGEISLAAGDESTREMLVALDRSIQSQSLDREAIDEIREILKRTQERR